MVCPLSGLKSVLRIKYLPDYSALKARDLSKHIAIDIVEVLGRSRNQETLEIFSKRASFITASHWRVFLRTIFFITMGRQVDWT